MAETLNALDQRVVAISAMAGVMRQVGHPNAGFPLALVRHWLTFDVGAAPVDVEFMLDLMADYRDENEWRECVNPQCEVRGSWKQSDTCGICGQPTRSRNG